MTPDPHEANNANDSRTPPSRRARHFFWMSAIVVWAFAVGVGLESIWAYNVNPGAANPAPAIWPTSPLVQPISGQATLIMFVHPQCPCSRASIAELRVALERAPRPVSVWVLFLRPRDVDETWENTALWRSAAAIPGVHVLADNNGIEASRFGVATSGHAVLYDAQGRFLFSGGMTASRGHVGDNFGLQQVLKVLNGGAPDPSVSPVFGCSLHDPAESRT